MKYTEQFFKFPVRIYDRYSVQNSEKREEMENAPVEGDWTIGQKAIPYTEITDYGDYFDSEEGISSVEEHGFTSTIIFTKDAGVFISPLIIEDFEERLNKHVDNLKSLNKGDIDNLQLKLVDMVLEKLDKRSSI